MLWHEHLAHVLQIHRLGSRCHLGKMILETPHVILRPFAADDLDRMAELMANKDFMRFSTAASPARTPMTREQTQSFLDKVIAWDREGLPSQFAMILRSSGTLVGYCGFFHHEVDGKMEIEIGYRLQRDFWNRGLTTEAARAVRDHGFRDLKLEYVISLVHPENHASRRVAEKNGMILERETTFRGFPTFVFAMTRTQWMKLSGE
jgi:ribosomal-protein-alanine N-acetyltransferase